MFLAEPPLTPEVSEALQKEQEAQGYVMNLSRLWAWRQDVDDSFVKTRRTLLAGSSLTPRETFVVICAMAGVLRDSYCSIAVGIKLAGLSSAAAAAAVLSGTTTDGLTVRELALADWARKVAGTPNTTTQRDIASLRQAGLSDREIFEATVLTAFRLAFSTVNDALGALPDAELVAILPDELKLVIGYGRPPAVA